MPTYDIEMLWECGQCSALGNKGRKRECAKCGRPKDETCREYFPDDVSPAAAIQNDYDGPDRKCPYCKTLQDAGWRVCSRCGSEKTEGGLTYNTEELSLTENAHGGGRRVGSRKKQVKGSGMFDDPTRQGYEGARSIPPTTSSLPTAGVSRTKRFYNFWLKRYMGRLTLAAALSLMIWFVIWLFTPKDVTAKVAFVSWINVVHVERYQEIVDTGWSPPGDAHDVMNLGRRVHHYDKVLDHYETVYYNDREACGQDCRTVRGSCRTTSRTCTSRGDGTARCSGGDRVCAPDRRACETKYCSVRKSRREPRYREEPRYASWYSWKAWRWRHNRDVEKKGFDLKPFWPTEQELFPSLNPLRPGEQERQFRESSYRVTFKGDDGEEYSYSPKTETDFMHFNPGTTRKLRVSPLSVEILQ